MLEITNTAIIITTSWWTENSLQLQYVKWKMKIYFNNLKSDRYKQTRDWILPAINKNKNKNKNNNNNNNKSIDLSVNQLNLFLTDTNQMLYSSQMLQFMNNLFNWIE